jgi:hypothetical protein
VLALERATAKVRIKRVVMVQQTRCSLSGSRGSLDFRARGLTWRASRMQNHHHIAVSRCQNHKLLGRSLTTCSMLSFNVAFKSLVSKKTVQ